MAPFKSSLARSASKLFGVFNQTDLSLRGATQISRTPPPEKVTASGGDIVDALAPGNGYKYHTFSSPGNFTVTAGFGSLAIVEILVVAGGGSGSSTNIAGGAGGGGVVHATGYEVTPGTYPYQLVMVDQHLPLVDLIQPVVEILVLIHILDHQEQD